MLSIVTLCGKPGSGTSSAVKELREIGYMTISSGDIFRQQAKEKFPELPLEEALKAYRELAVASSGEVDRKLDSLIIEWIKKRVEERRFLVAIDSRLAWYFCNKEGIHVLNVLLECDDHEAAERTGEREGKPMEQAFIESRDRTRADLLRYHEFYGINPDTFFHQSNFDLVVNSKRFKATEIGRIIHGVMLVL